MRYRCQFIFIHVAGIRMIGQETDGLYRGRLYEGAMNGKSMLSFLPLGESALKRSEPLGRQIYQRAYDLGRSSETLDLEG